MRIMFKTLLKPIAIFSSIFFLVALFCLILIGSENIILSITNFAVDFDDRLYLGAPGKIYVYENGQLLTTLNPLTSRSYAFTITQDNKILLSTASTIYLMNLDGSIISQEEDLGAEMYNHLQYNRKYFLSSKGDSYRMVSTIGRTQIIKNTSEIVYQMSLPSFGVKVLIALSSISMYAFGIWILVQVTKAHGRGAQGQGDGLREP